MTSTRQYQDNQQYYNHEQQYQHHHHDNNNNNILPGAGRVEYMTPEECDMIREAYVDNIGPMTGAAAKLIEQAFDAGLTAEEIKIAIEETGLAPRPSPYYLRAILKEWAQNGVTYSKLYHECRVNNARKWWKDYGSNY